MVSSCLKFNILRCNQLNEKGFHPNDVYANHSFALTIFSQIYWLKDRVGVQPERDPNYLQAADGHLIIVQAREKDRANYTCVAENVANRRLSPPARLNIHGKERDLKLHLCFCGFVLHFVLNTWVSIKPSLKVYLNWGKIIWNRILCTFKSQSNTMRKF